MEESREYTIADVARHAGVSISTVSRILNGKQDVADATRMRVNQVIEDLGYAPHAQARNLRAGKTRSIAMIFPHKYPSNMPFNPLDIDFIVGGAAAAGERSFLFNLLASPITKRSLLELYRSAQIDATVLMQVHVQDWRVDLLHEKGLPFVMIGRAADNDEISFVDIDFEAAVRMAFDHLINLGHRQIGFLGHPRELHNAGYGPAVRAWQGYEAALHAHNVVSLYRETGFSGNAIYQKTIELLEETPKLTAIVTTHADAGMHILHALHVRGRRIPEDCSVIALTASRIAELSSPKLSYIDFPSYEMGYNAVATLIRMVSGEVTSPEQILITPRLVPGDTTGPV